ncbi:C40 family peptidase [Nocardioides yefusunii]|uniref:NlpC/P60 family protein n=1 Tax=Nocardioides yefusunii TaxID=2500546 RepID=A0ABW1QV55_9ACTN|nr:C40 family peptidase [Nocardioides yefusunii]
MTTDRTSHAHRIRQARGVRRSVGMLAVLAVAGAAAVLPAQAEPTVEEASAKVDRLYQQAEQAQERLNDAKERLGDLDSEVSSLSSDEKRQNRRMNTVREQVRDSVVRQYQGEGVNTVGQVIVSEDPASFLAQLSTLESFNDLQDALLSGYTAEVAALDLRQEATRERRGEVKKTTKALATEKAEVESKLAEAKKVLDGLRPAERAAIEKVKSPEAPELADVPVSGRAKAAVSYALAQVGDRYVHGAVGPDAFDCSGLTMMAWAQAGVSLPHSSALQYAQGRKVSRNELQPGDLVFYYSPISHVGIYIGNGKIVDAANPRTGVRVAPVFQMPFSGAVRPG